MIPAGGDFLRSDRSRLLGAGAAGLAAGVVNGVFGAAGGMLLIPALQLLCRVPEEELFPTSVSVMLPVSIVSLMMAGVPLPLMDALPYLLGSVIGGVLAGLLGDQLPTLWLHRFFGAMILWGGIRYLW